MLFKYWFTNKKKNCNYIIIEFHFPKFYEDSISIFIVFRMRCGGCFLSKLFKSSLIVLTAERSQKLLIENSKFGNNDLFYRNIFHSKWRKYTLFRLLTYILTSLIWKFKKMLIYGVKVIVPVKSKNKIVFHFTFLAEKYIKLAFGCDLKQYVFFPFSLH